MFDEVLNKLENDEYKNFLEKYMEYIPPYFYKVPASSTGKYHPEYCLGEGGLYRHTIAACRILEYLFDVFHISDSETRDCMRVAMAVHDTFKSGTQEEYEKDALTKHEHPLIAAAQVELVAKLYSFNVKWNLIVECVECHMGKWNKSKYSDTILPIPLTQMELMVHGADYLASRKDIEVKFDE